jgi:hypothetical protein
LYRPLRHHAEGFFIGIEMVSKKGACVIHRVQLSLKDNEPESALEGLPYGGFLNFPFILNFPYETHPYHHQTLIRNGTKIRVRRQIFFSYWLSAKDFPEALKVFRVEDGSIIGRGQSDELGR